MAAKLCTRMLTAGLIAFAPVMLVAPVQSIGSSSQGHSAVAGERSEPSEPMHDDVTKSLTGEDLAEWAKKASSESTAYATTNPCDAFFASPEIRDQYAAPYNEHICLIDVAAFPEGPIEGLEYSKRSEVFLNEGNSFLLLLSSDQDRLAVSSAYVLEALQTGALSPDELAGPAPEAVATAIAVGVAKCAKNATCRGAVVKGAKWVAGAVAGGGLWDGIKSLF